MAAVDLLRLIISPERLLRLAQTELLLLRNDKGISSGKGSECRADTFPPFLLMRSAGVHLRRVVYDATRTCRGERGQRPRAAPRRHILVINNRAAQRSTIDQPVASAAARLAWRASPHAT